MGRFHDVTTPVHGVAHLICAPASSHTKKNEEDVMTKKTTKPPPEDAILLSSGSSDGRNERYKCSLKIFYSRVLVCGFKHTYSKATGALKIKVEGRFKFFKRKAGHL